MINRNLKEVKLGEVIKLSYGVGLPKKVRKSGVFPVIGSGGIIGYNNKYLIEGPGIVVGRKGSIGTIHYEKRNFWPIDTVFYVELLSDEIDLKFLRYLLTQSNLSELNSDAAVPGLNRYVAYSQSVKIPSISVQKRIASILTSYDDLIENNTHRIHLLEELAQLIYKEWFVNYRFPGHENVKKVDSITEFGAIPLSWKVDTLEEVLEVLESGSRPKGGIDPSETGVPSVGAENILGLGKYDFSKEKYVSNTFYERMSRGVIKSGDVLLYKDGAKIGRKSLFRDGFPHGICCINEHVFILRTNDRITQNYLYFWLDQDNMTQKIVNLNSNAAQPGISQPKVLSLPILVPTHQCIVDFDRIVEPLLALLFNLAKKNLYLNRSRDLLLPRLISGELDVSEFDIEIS